MRPMSFDAAWAQRAKFYGRAGLLVVLLSDFLTQCRRPCRHIDQDVARWRIRAPLARDADEVFRLQRCRGVSGKKPWVGTEAALRQVYAEYFSDM